MKLGKPILLGIAAVVGYILYKGARLSNVSGKVKFLFRGISFQGINVVAKIAVLNPTNTQIDFTSFVGDVFVGSKVVATAQSFQPVKVFANSQQDISITFVPNGFGIVQFITDAINKEISGKLTLKGFANMNGFTVPVKLDW